MSRTAAEIQHYMNCELSNPTSQTGLVAYYQFNQGIDSADNTALTTLADSSATAYIATLTNFALNGTLTQYFFEQIFAIFIFFHFTFLFIFKCLI